jgi:hypothetical protein
MQLKQFNDMFVPAKEANEKKPEEVLSQLDAIVKSARECVNAQSFHRYKAQFEKEEKEMLTVMISFTNTFILNENGNPAMYGMRMAMYVQKLYDLRRLLRSVEIDASRKIGE